VIRRCGVNRPLCDRCKSRHEIGAACIEKLKRAKHCYLGAPEVFSLGQACSFIGEAFGETWSIYLVGSVLERSDFRDVDVRMIMGDAKWRALFGSGENGEILPFWSLTCTALSEYLAKRTGLRIDFQIQSMSQANGKLHGGKRREGLCVWLGDSNGPAWSKLDWNAPIPEGER
jgi:hypothetical protein